MPNYLDEPSAAKHFQVHPRTIANWIGKGLVRGYIDDQGTVFVDTAEVEHALPRNPRMRDGRRSRYGSNAKIVPLPFAKGTAQEDDK